MSWADPGIARRPIVRAIVVSMRPGSSFALTPREPIQMNAMTSAATASATSRSNAFRNAYTIAGRAGAARRRRQRPRRRRHHMLGMIGSRRGCMLGMIRWRCALAVSGVHQHRRGTQRQEHTESRVDPAAIRGLQVFWYEPCRQGGAHAGLEAVPCREITRIAPLELCDGQHVERLGNCKVARALADGLEPAEPGIAIVQR